MLPLLHRLATRLVVTYVLLVAFGVGGLILWTGTRLQAATFEQEQRNLEVQAQLVANALRGSFQRGDDNSSPPSELDSMVGTFAEQSRLSADQSPARVTVVDARLRVLASSDSRVTQGGTETTPEFLAAQSGIVQADVRRDPLSGEQRVFVAAPVRGEEDVAGFVQLSAPTGPIDAAIRQMWLGLLGVGAVILTATALVSLWLARGIARPVQTLTRVSGEIAEGHLERRVSPDGPGEIARLGRTFNSMAERLEQLIHREKQFAGNAAHELRSPLTGLRLRLELLQSAAQTNPAVAARYLQQMERETTQLQRVVDQLLALAALDEGARAVRTRFDPAPLLYDLADELSPLVQDAQVELQVEVPDHLPLVNANADQVRMATRNLLDNAFKYTPPHGQVILQALPDEGGVTIAVSDTGTGIAPDALPYIFERFYREDTARTNRVRGSGLGLALARSIVQANDGELTVASVPGKGSTFAIHLPRV